MGECILRYKDMKVCWEGFLGGFPQWSRTRLPCRRYKRCRFDPWLGKVPWRRTWQPTPAFLPGESHGLRRLKGYRPLGLKELDTTEATEHATCYQGLRRIHIFFLIPHQGIQLFIPSHNFRLHSVPATYCMVVVMGKVRLASDVTSPKTGANFTGTLSQPQYVC